MAKRISWETKLERAEERGSFTRAEKLSADSWATCAVGEKHDYKNQAELPYELYKLWYNSTEYRLGMEFMYAVGANDIALAKPIYNDLQQLPLWTPPNEVNN